MLTISAPRTFIHPTTRWKEGDSRAFQLPFAVPSVKAKSHHVQYMPLSFRNRTLQSACKTILQRGEILNTTRDKRRCKIAGRTWHSTQEIRATSVVEGWVEGTGGEASFRGSTRKEKTPGNGPYSSSSTAPGQKLRPSRGIGWIGLDWIGLDWSEFGTIFQPLRSSSTPSHPISSPHLHLHLTTMDRPPLNSIFAFLKMRLSLCYARIFFQHYHDHHHAYYNYHDN
ncbi:hypothetical protein WAI453_011612 [Rhynchosporium graminicola]